MAIPKAVESSVKTPGIFLSVDLLGGTAGAGGAAEKGLIIAQKNTSDGDITADTEVRTLGGADTASTSHGSGSMGHLMAQRAYERYKLGQFDIDAPLIGAGVPAEETIVLGSSPSVNSVFRIDCAGRQIDVPWSAGESATVARDRAILSFNGFSAVVPAVASAGAGAGDLDITAKAVGVFGNDITIGAKFTIGGTGATVVAGGAKLSSGTLEPDHSNVLALVDTSEYRVVMSGMSNADFATTGASSNGTRLKNHINGFNTGLDALLQIGVAGCTDTIASVKGGAIDRNDPAMEVAYGQSFQSLPAELAAAEGADGLQGAARRANYNRIGAIFSGLFGPKDLNGDKLTAVETEDLLSNGATVISLAKATNEPILVKPITMHSQSGGNPDFRAHHMSDVYGAYFVADDLRSNIGLEFENASITEDLVAGDDALPAGVVERRDVEKWVHSRLRIHVRGGVVSGNDLSLAIEEGTLVVEIDSGDPSQVNIFIPLDIIKPLAKFGISASKQ